MEEFTDGLGDAATVLRGRCLPYGEGITYWPLSELVRDLAGDRRGVVADELADEPKAELIADVLAEAIGLGGLGGLADREDLLGGAAAVRGAGPAPPLVVVLDDLQWAEPTFLDLVEHVADLARASRSCCSVHGAARAARRPPGWGGGS